MVYRETLDLRKYIKPTKFKSENNRCFSKDRR